MGAIKDIVDLAKDLESRAKDRQDIEILHKIHSLTFALQSQHADIVERDLSLMQENVELKRQLAEANAEEVQFHSLVEFHRSKKTGGKWMAFCPKCKMPVADDKIGARPIAYCTAICGWRANLPMTLEEVTKELP